MCEKLRRNLEFFVTLHIEMKRVKILILMLLSLTGSFAQRTLTLDDCRQLAVTGNKKMAIERVKGDAAASMVKSTNTLSLPRVNAVVGYEHFGREISLLNNDQKYALSNLGTNAAGSLSTELTSVVTQLVQGNIITADQAQAIGSMLGEKSAGLASGLNTIGERLKNSLRTDAHDMFAGSVMVTQPIYMGGAINTAKEMAQISQKITATTLDQTRQNLLYDIDKAYWLVVQLSCKKKLAEEYTQLVKKLDSDVQKMIAEGVATRADGLKVNVALNEAEMTVLKVDDGIRLAKMLVCQQCDLPLESDITLADENCDAETLLASQSDAPVNTHYDISSRPELQLLSYTKELSGKSTNLLKALDRPQILANAGFLVTNPSFYNGFEKKFGANWNVGIVARIPLWNWNDTQHKVNAAKAITTIADLQMQEANELIELQISQNKFKLTEAKRQLEISNKNIEKAEENLRCANLGFQEGVMTSTDLMAAQTAWMQAEQQRIDACIEIILANLGLKKAVGKL